ncbi:hypothetical protein [Alistipes sp.]|uniref:hypothetical protein n=1 Tax=Alistipes sp. TaxID=1872444 RepID=UPI003A85CC0C
MTPDLQDYIAWAIVAAAVAVAAIWFWRLLCGRRKGGCASCSSTKCPLRELKRK